VLRDWYERTHQFRFERVSPTEIEKVTIASGHRELYRNPVWIVSVDGGPKRVIDANEPDAKKILRRAAQLAGAEYQERIVVVPVHEHLDGGLPKLERRMVRPSGETLEFTIEATEEETIDVRLFIRRRKQRPDHYLFGEDGAEVWYGGRIDMGETAIGRVWDAIEAKTEHRRTHPVFERWPMGRLDVRSHLPIAVDEFDDAEAEELVSPEIDDTDPENPVTLRSRRNYVIINPSLGLSPTDLAKVRDKGVPFDLREVRQYGKSIVRRKPPKGSST
jgi:hypothetical protein